MGEQSVNLIKLFRLSPIYPPPLLPPQAPPSTLLSFVINSYQSHSITLSKIVAALQLLANVILSFVALPPG